MEVGEEVVDCLSKDAGPVDRVYSAEVMGCVKFIISEEGFYDVLIPPYVSDM